MTDLINNWVVYLNDFIWTYMLIIPLVVIGLYFTFRSRFVQFRNIREMFSLLGEGIASTNNKDSNVSSFQAFCIATASRVGTGNMAGIATAVALGGPGAVFWMWLIALIGSASAFIESTLAQVYKEKGTGNFIGGPAFYITKGLKARWMGILFAVIIIITFGLVFNSVQANTISAAWSALYDFDPLYVGITLAIFTLIVIFGGIHRVALVSTVLVPIMAIVYILVSIYILLTHITILPEVIGSIFANAFGFEQVAAGGVGAALMQGIRRGLFSNEAGMGSAPNAAATATVSHPAKQGFIQALSVFTDTLIICTCTAFIILLSGVPIDGSVRGIELTQMALSNEIGWVGGQFISISILFFAFSSIVGNYSYCETNLYFLTNKRWVLNVYRFCVAFMVFGGAIAGLDLVWNLADVAMAIMTMINLVAIVLLGGLALRVMKDYLDQRRKGVKSPQFRIGKFPELKNTDSVWEE
ncbi:MAG: alanine/glycine:cation symporter family protein [Marinifilaceae bacterium]